MTEASRPPLSFLVCTRSKPATTGSRPPLALALEDLGHEVTTIPDGPADLSGYDVVLLWNNPGFFPRMRRQLRSLSPAERPLVVTYHAEPLPPPKISGLPRWPVLNASELGKIVLRDWRATDVYTNTVKLRRMLREGWLDLVFSSSVEKVEYLEEKGIRSWHVPYGYRPAFGTMLGLERTIDVLFLGDTRPLRRRRILRYLRRQGIDVDARGSWHDPALWGESRSLLLNQTKIVVHVQRYPGKVAAMRLVLALANGALVVAEPCYRPDPFVPGVHYVEGPVEELPDLIRYYLAHDEERERIVAAGHHLVTEELTFLRSAEKMVEIIREHLAPGEGVTRPPDPETMTETVGDGREGIWPR
jgi:hypothetical protein